MDGHGRQFHHRSSDRQIAASDFSFFVMGTFYNVYLYGFLHYPCNSGILPMLFAGLLLVLASQAFGVFLFGLFTTVRLALSTASLWGVISFSISGMSFQLWQ